MKPQAHYNPKSLKWLISLAVMIVLSVGVVVGTIAINKAVTEKNNQPVDINFEIASTLPVSLSQNELNITSIEKAFDANGNMVAYVVNGTVIGYNQEVPIELSTVITPDASVVCGVEVLKQEETEYLGVRIQTDEFQNQFKGKKLPVKNASSLTKGSSIDMLAKSTISSQAVVDGVNNAKTYVETFLAQ